MVYLEQKHIMWLQVLVRRGRHSCSSFHKVWAKMASPSAAMVLRDYSSVNPRILRSSIEYTPRLDVGVWEFLTEGVEKFGDKPAVKCGVKETKYSFSESVDLSERLAGGLHRLGINKGDVVLSLLYNCPEFLLITLACARLGAVLSPASPSFTADELSRQLAISKAKILVTSQDLKTVALEAGEKYNSDLHTLLVDDPDSGIQPLLRGEVGVLPHPTVDPVNDTFLLPFSSGTTGVPKGVMQSHGNIVNNILQQKVSGEGHHVENTETFQNNILGLLPMYHCYGMNVILLPNFKYRSCTITLPKFDPNTFVAAMKKNKFHVLLLVPPLIQFMIADPRITPEQLNEVHQITTGGAPLGKTLGEKIVKKAQNSKMRLTEGYGLTETGPVTHLTHKKLGCIGKVVPGTDAKIVNPENKEVLGANQEGEICIRGPQIMLGYFENPKATSETLIDDWLHTGDIGYYDDEGFFFVTGRLKELIKVKGQQVSPSELEDLLRRHPRVADVAVIGIPDERSGEVPRAFVVKKDPSLTEQQVTEFLHPQISRHKHLKGGVTFVDAIPKNPTGKILRRVIKETLL